MTTTSDNRPVPMEIDVHAVKRLLDSGQAFVFLDCREPDEFEFCRITGARLLPIKQMSTWLPDFTASREQLIVIHCHTGRRSLKLANSLRELGFPQAQSMKGGIQAWSDEIDPNIPVY